MAFEAVLVTDRHTADAAPTKADNVELLSQLGEIAVKCVWLRRVPGAVRAASDSSVAASGQPIPEKCLKGRAISGQAT